MEEANLIKNLEVEFHKCKLNLKKKIIDFKDSRKNIIITHNYNSILNKVNFSRQESLNIVNGLYDTLVKSITDELNEFDTFLSSTPIDDFSTKIEELSDDTYQHKAKKFKRESSEEFSQEFDDYESVLKRRIDIINDLKETIDLKAIYDKKLNENWSNLDLINKKIKKFKENLDYEFNKKQKDQVKDSEIKFLKEISNEKLLSSTSNELTIWDRQNFQILNQLKTGSQEITSVLPLDTEGVLMAVGFMDGTIKIWNNHLRSIIKFFNAHNTKITSFAFINDSEFMSGSQFGELKIWNKNLDFHSTWRSKKFKAAVNCILSYNLNGLPLMVCGLECGTIVNIVATKQVAYYYDFKHTRSILCLEKLESKDFVFAASSDYLINVWCMKSKKKIHTIRNHNEPIRFLKIFDDSSLFILTGNKLILSNFDERKLIKETYLNQDDVTCSIISNTFTIVNGTLDKRIQTIFPLTDF